MTKPLMKRDGWELSTDLSLDAFICILQETRAHLTNQGWVDLTVESEVEDEYGYQHARIYISGDRPETEQEAEARKRSDAKARAIKDQADFAEYQKLKARFEAK